MVNNIALNPDVVLSIIGLENARNAWNAIHPEKQIHRCSYGSLQELKASGIGTTIFAAYSAQGEWRFRQIGRGYRVFAWFIRILRKCRYCRRRLGLNNTVLPPERKIDLLAMLIDTASDERFTAFRQNVVQCGEELTYLQKKLEAIDKKLENPQQSDDEKIIRKRNIRRIKTIDAMMMTMRKQQWLDGASLREKTNAEHVDVIARWFKMPMVVLTEPIRCRRFSD